MIGSSRYYGLAAEKSEVLIGYSFRSRKAMEKLGADGRPRRNVISRIGRKP
jgi:hypothetical protein